MPTPSTPAFRYVHPDAIVQTCTRTESDGTQLRFQCPLCGGKASFNTVKRIGRCFVCEGIIRLHNKYDRSPIGELFSDLPPHCRIATQVSDDVSTRADIETRPLSQPSIDYITSRGVDLEVVKRFGLLEETTYRNGVYLAWPTADGNYELRATFPTMVEKVTPKGHQKHFTLAKLAPDTSTCIVCEGLFSALAYAQLFQRFDAWYVILNLSVSWHGCRPETDTSSVRH
jgi:hypothetical protein